MMLSSGTNNKACLKGHGMDVTDLASLLPFLRERSGVLHLEPAEGVEGGESWHAYLLLAEGNVESCYVRGRVSDRVLLSGAHAIAWLADLGALIWWWEEPPHVSLSD